MTDKHILRPAEGPPGSNSGLASRSAGRKDRRSYQHPERIGRYEVHADPEITDSSFVYEGWDPALERKVAIKAMRLSDGDPEEIEEARLRFQRSARAASTFHPNIVSVYDYLEGDGTAYIVMEFVEGGSLKDRIEQRRPFTRAEIAAIMNDLLAALSYSHRMGIVHRDIKPANILLSNEGRWKLTDFGIARFRSSIATRVGTFMGTPAYSSPEQIRTESVDNRTDIYSCGVVLYELLTGQRPFRGSEETVRRKIQEEIAPPPSSINSIWSPQLDRVVAKAMAKYRDDRFSTVEEFQAALQQGLGLPRTEAAEPASGDSTVVFRPDQRLTPGTARIAKRINYPLVAGLAGAVLLLGGGGFVLLNILPGHPSQKIAATTRPAEAPKPPAAALAPATPNHAEISPSAPEPAARMPAEPNPQFARSAEAPAVEAPRASADNLPVQQPADQQVEPPTQLMYQPPHTVVVVPAYRPEPSLPPPQPPASPQITRPPAAHPPKATEKPSATGDRTPIDRSQPDRRTPPSGVQSLADAGKSNEARQTENRRADNKLALLKPGEPSAPAEPAPQPAATAWDIGVFCGPVSADTPNLPEETDPSSLLRVVGAAQGLAGSNAGIRPGDILVKGGGLSTRGDGYASCVVSSANGSRSATIKVWRRGHWDTVTLRSN